MARTACDVPDETLRLLLTPGIGPRTLARLRDRLGDDRAIVRASPRVLAEIPGIGPTSARQLHEAIRVADPDDERRLMDACATRLILLDDTDYPPLLAAIDDPPPALWVRGTLVDEDHAALAVVGSRRCSAYGQDRAASLAARLAECGLTIVSGGALGIDASAHRGALRVGGRTIAVLGCGLARCYPSTHAELFEQVVRTGSALVSELPMLARPLAHHFPKRNRIISGLSLGVLVVEAARRSGALITARLAAEDHGREVMVVPGRSDVPTARGALGAVRDGWAALVLDEQDVLQQLASSGHLVRGAIDLVARRRGRVDAPAAEPLTTEQQAILEQIDTHDEPPTVDQLAAALGRSVHRLMADLTLLELLRHLEVRGGHVLRASDNPKRA